MEKYYDRIAIPIGIDTENQTMVNMKFSAIDTITGVNGYQVYTQNPTAMINRIIANGSSRYTEAELEFSVLNCARPELLNLSIPTTNVNSYSELLEALKAIEAEVISRQEIIGQNKTRFIWYQQEEIANKFSQKIIFINELFSLSESCTTNERSSENCANDLLHWLSCIGWRFGIYFVFTLKDLPRYASTSSLSNFIGRIYGASCKADARYRINKLNIEDEIMEMRMDELIVFHGYRNDLYYKCRAMDQNI